MLVVDEVLHADQEHVYSPRPFHREVLGIVPGKMEKPLQFLFIYQLNLSACTVYHRIKAEFSTISAVLICQVQVGSYCNAILIYIN